MEKKFLPLTLCCLFLFACGGKATQEGGASNLGEDFLEEKEEGGDSSGSELIRIEEDGSVSLSGDFFGKGVFYDDVENKLILLPKESSLESIRYSLSSEVRGTKDSNGKLIRLFLPKYGIQKYLPHLGLTQIDLCTLEDNRGNLITLCKISIPLAELEERVNVLRTNFIAQIITMGNSPSGPFDPGNRNMGGGSPLPPLPDRPINVGCSGLGRFMNPGCFDHDIDVPSPGITPLSCTDVANTPSGDNETQNKNHPCPEVSRPFSIGSVSTPIPESLPYRRTDFDPDRGPSRQTVEANTTAAGCVDGRSVRPDGCDFDTTWCGFTPGVTRVFSTGIYLDGFVDRANDAGRLRLTTFYSSAAQENCFNRTGYDPNATFYCTSDTLASGITMNVPAGVTRVRFNLRQEVAIRSATDSLYRIPLSVQLDGGTRSVESNYTNNRNEWVFIEVPISNPATSHTLILSLYGFFSASSPPPIFGTFDTFIDNVRFEYASGGACTESRTYSARITDVAGVPNTLAGMGGLPALIGSAGGRDPAPIITVVNGRMDVRVTTQGLQYPGTRAWLQAFDGNRTDIFPSNPSIDYSYPNRLANPEQTLVAEMTGYYNADSRGGRRDIRLVDRVHFFADYDPPRIENISIRTLPEADVVLPWLGATVQFDASDDVGLRNFYIAGNLNSSVFASYFARDIYGSGRTTTIGSRRVILSPLQLDRGRSSRFQFATSFSFTLGARDLVDRASGARSIFVPSARVYDLTNNPEIYCNTYELYVGETTPCGWLPAVLGEPPSPIKVKFKVWKYGEIGDGPTSADHFLTEAVWDPAAGMTTRFAPEECGIYDVEAILVTDAGLYLGKRSPNVARFRVPCSVTLKPIAIGMHDGEVLICSDEPPCKNSEEDILSYTIWRRPEASPDEDYELVGEISKEDFVRDCFPDVVPENNNRYSYKLKGLKRVSNGGLGVDRTITTNFSAPDIANVYQRATEFGIGNVASTEDPSRVTLKSGYIASDPAPGRHPVIEPLDNVFMRLIPMDNFSSDFCFLYHDPAGGGALSYKCRLGENGIVTKADDRGTQTLSLSFRGGAYNRDLYARLLSVIVGDFAEKYEQLSRRYQERVLTKMSAEVAQMNLEDFVFHTRPTAALSYHTPPAFVFDAEIPLIHSFITEGLSKFYYDPADRSGVLKPAAWRNWANLRSHSIFPRATAEPVDLSGFNPNDGIDPAEENLIQTLAANDVVSLIEHHQQPGNNLLGTGSTLIDWLNYYDLKIYEPYLFSFLREAHFLDNANAAAIAGAITHISEVLLAPEISLMQRIEGIDPVVAAFVHSIDIAPLANLEEVMERADAYDVYTDWTRDVLKPYLESFPSPLSAGLKGLFIGSYSLAHNVPHSIACSLLNAGSPSGTCNAMAAALRGTLQQMENELDVNRMVDPWEAGPYEFGRIFPDLALLIPAATAPIRSAYQAVTKLGVPFRFTPSASAGESLVTTARLEKAATGEVFGKITVVFEEASGTARVAGLSTNGRPLVATELIEQAVPSETHTLRIGVSSNRNPLKRSLDEARAASRPLEEAVRCSDEGIGAVRIGKPKIQVIVDGGGNPAHIEMGENIVNEALLHPARFDDFPNEILNPDFFAGGRVDPHPTFHKIAESKEMYRGVGGFRNQNDVRDYADSILERGAFSGPTAQTGIPAANHAANLPPCPVARDFATGEPILGGIGGGPRPEGGWVSVTTNEAIAHSFMFPPNRRGDFGVVVGVRNRAGESIVYDAHLLGEHLYPNQIPQADILYVEIHHRQLGHIATIRP